MTQETYKGWKIEIGPAGITVTATDETTKDAYLAKMTGGKPERIALFRENGVLASNITTATVEQIKGQIDKAA